MRLRVAGLWCVLVLSGCAANTAVQRQPRVQVLKAGQPQVAPLAQDRLTRYAVNLPFVIRVRAQAPVTIQVCASDSARIFEQMRPGVPAQEVPCYRVGTGMATSRRGDDPRGMRLFLSDGSAHNYYSAERRVDGPGYSDLYVANIVGRDVQPFRGGTVYAVVFVDDNRHRVMDDAEFEFLELRLTK